MLFRSEEGWYFGRKVVEVRDADVEGVTIVPVRAGRLVARVMFNSTPASFSRLRIEPDGQAFQPAVTQFDGVRSLSVDVIVPTTYKVRIDGLASDLYISLIRFNGVDSVVPSFTPSENALDGTLDIDLAKGNRIEGRVSDENDNRLAGKVVVLVPLERARHDLYRDSPSDEQGVFHFDGVTPGTYKLFAWDNIPSGAFLNADFLKEYEDLGRQIAVEGPIHLDVPLKVIRSESH